MSGASFMALAGIGGRLPVVITYTDTDNSVTSLTTFTFTAKALGAAGSGRYIAIGVHGEINAASGSISSVTVQGIAATQVVQQSNVSTFTALAGLYLVPVPTGTTGDVVVTFSAAASTCGIGVFAVTNANPTATATATATSATANPQSLSLNIPAMGGAIAISYVDVGVSVTATWTGLTEAYDTQNGGRLYTGSASTFMTAQTSLGITCASTGGAPARVSMVAAAFQQA